MDEHIVDDLVQRNGGRSRVPGAHTELSSKVL